MNAALFEWLMSLGLTPDEIACSLEPGPWALSVGAA